jgi:hypothetical protein
MLQKNIFGQVINSLGETEQSDSITEFRGREINANSTLPSVQEERSDKLGLYKIFLPILKPTQAEYEFFSNLQGSSIYGPFLGLVLAGFGSSRIVLSFWSKNKLKSIGFGALLVVLGSRISIGSYRMGSH